MCKIFVGYFFSPVRIIVEMDALLVRLSPRPIRPPLGFALVVERDILDCRSTARSRDESQFTKNELITYMTKSALTPVWFQIQVPYVSKSVKPIQ